MWSWSDVSALGLDLVSSKLRQLDLCGNYAAGFNSSSVDALSRFAQLSSLTLQPEFADSSCASEFLSVLPSVAHLAMPHADVADLLTIRRPTLRSLSLIDSTGPLGPTVHAVVEAITAHSSNLPVLRELRVDQNFGDRLEPDEAWLFVVGPQLRVAGVAFLDCSGYKWQQEWEVEAQRAADAGASFPFSFADEPRSTLTPARPYFHHSRRRRRRRCPPRLTAPPGPAFVPGRPPRSSLSESPGLLPSSRTLALTDSRAPTRSPVRRSTSGRRH